MRSCMHNTCYSAVVIPGSWPLTHLHKVGGVGFRGVAGPSSSDMWIPVTATRVPRCSPGPNYPFLST